MTRPRRGGPDVPKSLNSRHKLLATRFALGDSVAEAAKATGYSETRVAHIKMSQEFKDEVAREQVRVREQVTHEALGYMIRQTPKTVRRLAELRDQNENLPVAARAADSILDRIIPKVERKEEERTIRIVFDAQTITEMRDAQRAAGRLVLPDAEDAELES